MLYKQLIITAVFVFGISWFFATIITDNNIKVRYTFISIMIASTIVFFVSTLFFIWDR